MGSSNLGTFVKENKEKLAADVVLISDTSMIAKYVSRITTGLLGLAYLAADVVGVNSNLSSVFDSGAGAERVDALCGMIGIMAKAVGLSP